MSPHIIKEESISDLSRHGDIAIAFEVQSVGAVETGPDGWRLGEVKLVAPWIKDYDAIKGEGPTRWARRWDVSKWGLLGAYCDGGRVGGAVIAFDTPGVNMLEGRKDLAVLWDLRVAPQRRGQGVGGALFRAAEAWAVVRGCRQLKVETQNINVPACRFYERMGCTLGAVNPDAYADLPDEVQLLWYRDLAGERTRPTD